MVGRSSGGGQSHWIPGSAQRLARGLGRTEPVALGNVVSGVALETGVRRCRVPGRASHQARRGGCGTGDEETASGLGAEMGRQHRVDGTCPWLAGGPAQKEGKGGSLVKGYLLNALLDEGGLTTVEYALLLALLVVTAVVLWTTLGRITRNIWWGASNGMQGIRNPDTGV